jgi:DNA modification methylase
MTVQILNGDCRVVLPTLPAQSVHCIVTSPPYFGLRDYGVDGQIGLEQTPDAFVAELVAVFREARRVLRDDGTLWLNLGDSYASKFAGERRNAMGAGSPDPSVRRANRLFGLKEKDLIGIPWRVAFALQADGWYLRQDIIWCLSGGASVYARTQKGDMPMMVKDMVRLRPETVKLWNGEKWTQVLGWSRSKRPRDGALEIELRSGERIGCTPGHQWPTERGVVRADDLRIGDVIATTRLPQPDAPRDPAALGNDVAWLCGLYLAEGSINGNTIQLAGHADETANRLSRIEGVAASFDAPVGVHTDGNNATIRIEGALIASVIRAYIHGVSAHDKGIKVRAWNRGDDWLRSLFEGYLAGDSHYDAKNDRWRLGFCRNDRLARDFRTLAARLGLSLRLAATTATGFGKEWPAYRGDVRLTPTEHHNARRDGEVVAIRASRAREFWDIGVEDEPHLFALASGVLTHNSKPNPMPESVRDRCTKAHEYLFLLSKRPRYYYDADAIAEPAIHAGRVVLASGDKAKNANAGFGSDTKAGFTKHDTIVAETRNKRSVWTVTAKPFSGAHFATFPPDLIEPCIKAGCPIGGTVLDPFGGAGTTGLVADRLQRNAVLIELNSAYAAMAAERLGPTENKMEIREDMF